MSESNDINDLLPYVPGILAALPAAKQGQTTRIGRF